ncbi:hypothetical protein [Rubrivivax gelatinosus]|uniref:DUF11 domain-containing protein n=1 Tax=Rubrivivax gelatinosus TaxID=28068 RepID=A0A4R2M6W2_RUBGE|nr:hypothetical protein [Rubrivivax gelatinosus]TCP03019.1 hypothetical protein EV684_105185 [Rubrivivax gelatinosus]
MCRSVGKIAASAAKGLILAATLALVACGGGRSSSESREMADISLTQTVQASTGAGESVTFTVVVANTAQVASVPVTLAWSVADVDVGEPTVSCTSASSAVCPTTVGASTTIDTLPAQRQLVFKYTVTLPSATRGDVVATAVATTAEEADASDNTASATTVAVDARNDSYEVYAADGKAYEMTVDFDAGTYTMSGEGVSDTRSFAADSAGGYIVGSGPERLRATDGVIVGVHSFGGTATPYIAANSFLTSTTGAAGNYNLMFRRVASDGSGATTHPATATLSSGALKVCESETEVLNASACGSGNARLYTVTIADGVFTATSSTSGVPSMSFRIAEVGDSEVLLSIGTSASSDGRLQWLGGLKEERIGLFAGSFAGPGMLSSDVDWVALTLDAAALTYGVVSDALTDQGVLQSANNQQPTSFFYTTLTTQYSGSPVWVMQNYPLVIVGGAPAAADGVTNLSGLLQIALP